MDFTVVRLLRKGPIDVKRLTRQRNSIVHGLFRKTDDPQLFVCEEIEDILYLRFLIPDTLQASLAKGGVLYTQPHEVMISAYIDLSTALLFVGSVNKNYVEAIARYLERELRMSTQAVEVRSQALLTLTSKYAVAFYGAEVQNEDGERIVVQRRSDFDEVLRDPTNHLLSVTITPKVETQELFMFTLKSKGTFHTNCNSHGELLRVFQLVTEAVDG